MLALVPDCRAVPHTECIRHISAVHKCAVSCRKLRSMGWRTVVTAAAGALIGGVLWQGLKVYFRAPSPRGPKRIILVRHGQSLGNVDMGVYQHTPDWRVPITEEGMSEAIQAGRRIGAIVKDDPIIFYVSPYKRTRMTFEGIVQGMQQAQSPVNVCMLREEPRIREQVRDIALHCHSWSQVSVFQ